jgi:hypothetical protein
MRTYAVLLIGMTIVVCIPHSRYVNLPGYAYKTDPTCRRIQPISKFDRRCDYPRLGFPNFVPPTIGIVGI